MIGTIVAVFFGLVLFTVIKIVNLRMFSWSKKDNFGFGIACFLLSLYFWSRTCLLPSVEYLYSDEKKMASEIRQEVASVDFEDKSIVDRYTIFKKIIEYNEAVDWFQRNWDNKWFGILVNDNGRFLEKISIPDDLWFGMFVNNDVESSQKVLASIGLLKDQNDKGSE